MYVFGLGSDVLSFFFFCFLWFFLSLLLLCYIHIPHQKLFKYLTLFSFVDIIKTRKLSRQQDIFLIRSTLKKAFDADVDIDKEKFILEISSTCNLARRTAMEYLNIALLAFNTQLSKEDGRVVIKNLSKSQTTPLDKDLTAPKT